jgi:hypothetical protein
MLRHRHAISFIVQRVGKRTDSETCLGFRQIPCWYSSARLTCSVQRFRSFCPRLLRLAAMSLTLALAKKLHAMGSSARCILQICNVCNSDLLSAACSIGDVGGGYGRQNSA